jgi:heme/copper-type cytochrome/quinol oxidase subunit 2
MHQALYLVVALLCSAIGGPPMWQRLAAVRSPVALEAMPPDVPCYDVHIGRTGIQITRPDGGVQTDDLYVPVHQPVHVIITSAEECTFAIPAMRVSRRVRAQEPHTVWFEATKVGTHPLVCRGGQDALAFEVRGTVHVLTAPDFAARTR